jgi:hypothetical protein
LCREQQAEIEKLKNAQIKTALVLGQLEKDLGDRDAEIERLRAILAFFYNQMQMHSPKMGGGHSWRFRHGWPMTKAIGPTPEAAINAAMEVAAKEDEK